MFCEKMGTGRMVQAVRTGLVIFLSLLELFVLDAVMSVGRTSLLVEPVGDIERDVFGRLLKVRVGIIHPCSSIATTLDLPHSLPQLVCCS